MSIKNLRLLAKQYFIGQIDRETYLEARHKLIDSVVSGEVLLPDDEDATSITVTAITETATTQTARNPRPPPSQPAEITLPAGKDNTSLIIGGVVVVALILAVSAASFFLAGDDDTSTIADKKQIVPGAVSTVVDTSPGLLETFLAANDWSDKTLQNTLQSWNELSTDARSDQNTSLSFRQLEDAINTQVLEARALMDIGDVQESIEKREQLLAFARELGSQDDRFKLARNTLEQDQQTSRAQTELAQVVETPPATNEPITAPVETLTALTEELVQADKPEEEEANTPAIPPVPEPAVIEEKVVEMAALEAQAPTVEAIEFPVLPETPTVEPPPAEPVAAPPSTPVPPTSQATKPSRPKGCRESLIKSRKPYCRDTLSDTVKGPVMVVLKGGSFTMGGSKKEESPNRKVSLPYNFALSMHEITAKEFKLFCKQTKRDCPTQPWSGEDYPIVNVSWDDAMAYTRWLSKYSGQLYRLPTEAEWEYAARSGTTGVYPTGDEILPSYARFSYSAALDSPLPKSNRTINRNKFRLYHMLGNVQEWVMDNWQASHQGAPLDGSAVMTGDDQLKVLRGGAYSDVADNLRSASRRSGKRSSGDAKTGFRVALVFGETADPIYKPNLQWLKAQNADQYTLQLFAVKNITNVKKLLDKHPALEMRIVPVTDDRFSYRVVYGAYNTEDEAKQAFSQLPLDISGQAGKAIVKRFDELL